MIYRLKFNRRDHAIVSCEEVETPLTDTHYIVYVEANDKPQAIERAKLKYEEFRRKQGERRAEFKKAGLCRDCGKPANGQLCCAACNERARVRARNKRLGVEEPRKETVRSGGLRLIILLEVKQQYEALGNKKFKAWLDEQTSSTAAVPVAAE